MATAKDHPSDDGFENLPANEQKETQDIIDEIAKDSNVESDKPEPIPEEKPAEKPSKEENKPEPKPEVKEGENKDEKNKDKSKDQEQSRKRGFVPVETHYSMKRDLETKVKDLETELTKARTTVVKENKEEIKPVAENKVDHDLKKETDAIAEKFGTDPDEEYERAVIARKSLKPQSELPEEIKEGIKVVNEFKAQQQIITEEKLFGVDFDSKILPLIKAEYGADVPQTTIDSIKEKVKEKAYSEEYAKVPLGTIYKGEDEFRGVIPKKDGGSQPSRGGHQAVHEESQDNDDLDISGRVGLTEAQILTLTDKQFDTYSDGRVTWERSQNKK